MGASPSSLTAARRIRKELRQLWLDPPAFCRPGAAAVTDLFHWEAVIDGPQGSPYAGGTFPVDIRFSVHHPFKPPKITFKTKVYHPNINSRGQMVLDIFKDNWSPALTINKLLLCIVSVLYDPMLDDPVDRDMACLYQSDIKLYEQKARVWTREHASAPVVSYYPEKGNAQWQECCADIAARYAEKKRRAVTGASLPCGRPVALLHRRSVASPTRRLLQIN